MNLNELSREIDQIAAHPETPNTLWSSIEHILKCLAIILESKGAPGWHLEVNRQLGSQFTEEHEQLMQPFVSALTQGQVGGGATAPPPTPPVGSPVLPVSTQAPVGSPRAGVRIEITAPDLSKTIKNKAAAVDQALQSASAKFNKSIESAKTQLTTGLKSAKTQLTTGLKSAIEDGKKIAADAKAKRVAGQSQATAAFGAVSSAVSSAAVSSQPSDGQPVYYESLILNFFKELTKKVQAFGPFNYDQSDKTDSDIRIGEIIANLLTKIPLFGIGTAIAGYETSEATLQKKKGDIVGPMSALRAFVLPRRFIGVALQTGVDILRLSVSQNSVIQRQILSLISIFLELSRDQWQNALLSAIGFYSQNAVYMGILAKVILNNFLMFDKKYGENILAGIITIPKSYVLGVVIFLYQTCATDQMRKKTIEFLGRVLEKEKELSQNIEGSQYADQLQQAMGATELNFDTLNLLQTIVHDRARTCSDKFQAILQKDDPAMNPILRVIFLLLDIPLTPEELVAMCPGKNLTWAELAFKNGKTTPDVKAPSDNIIPVVEPVKSSEGTPAEAIQKEIPIAKSEDPSAPVTNSKETSAEAIQKEAAPINSKETSTEAIQKEAAPINSKETSTEAIQKEIPIAKSEDPSVPVTNSKETSAEAIQKEEIPIPVAKSEDPSVPVANAIEAPVEVIQKEATPTPTAVSKPNKPTVASTPSVTSKSEIGTKYLQSIKKGGVRLLRRRRAKPSSS